MTNYYDILGISKDSSNEEIKRRYKQLAMKNHPDKGGDKEQFQKIQEAYEVLSDENKRKSYDSPNINNNLDDMFNFNHPFFRHHQNQTRNITKKQDHFYNLKVKLDDIYHTINKRLKIGRKNVCKICIVNCSKCGGSGMITQHLKMGPFTQIIQQTCGECSGIGKKNKSDCKNCDNNGYIAEEKLFEIKISKESKTGDRFVFEGWGEQAVRNDDISGNFIVNLIVDEHPIFTRSDQDLLMTINLTFTESIVGKHLVIPHFQEEILLDTCGFGLINPNKEYIIYNRGLSSSGNLRLKFKIEYPERSFSNSELLLLKETFIKVKIN